MTSTEPRSRNAIVIGVIILAALVAVGLVVWLLTRGGDDGVTQASSTPTASTSASEEATASPTTAETPAPPTAWNWELHELPGGPIRGAARIGDRWVALDGLEAWTSTDAATWEPATVDDPHPGEGTTQMGPVAELGGAWYSVGNWFSGGENVDPVVWRSEDGTAWTLVPQSDEWGYYANDVATDGTQLAVAGNEFQFGLGHVWTSTDGATWTERTSDGGPSTMNAIHGDADGFVSVGYRLDEAGNGLPAIWHSADGESWTDAELPPTDGAVSLLDVVRMPSGRYVALGVVGVQLDAGAYVIWYADDPSTWTDAAELTGGSLPGFLLAVDGGALAITGTLEGPAVRFSADGATWEEVPNFVQPDRLARATAAATDGSTVIILGGTDEADAHFVWLGTPITD